MAVLPTEIQLMILEHIVHIVPNTGHSPDHFSDCSMSYCAGLGIAFLAARTAASAPAPPPAEVCVHFQCPIWQIGNPLILRVALAWALPAWRRALCGIPSLWRYIVVALDGRTRSADVLDAVREAAECARGQLLSIVITCAPTEDEQRHTSNEQSGDGEDQAGMSVASMGKSVRRVEVDNINGEDERAHVGQIMALLVPHMARWSALHIHVFHYVALPVPTVAFAGDASMLHQVSLRAVTSPPTATRASASSLAQALDVSNLRVVKMDLWIFCAALLFDSGALSRVRFLELHGPDIKDRRGPPTTSVRELLAYVAQMPELSSLTLDSVHLGVEGEEMENGSVESNTSTMPRSNPSLASLASFYCRCLSAAVLGKLLGLAIPANDILIINEDYCSLHISKCSLPRNPTLHHYDTIKLDHIPAGEDVGAFLEDAAGCMVLDVQDCPNFPVRILGRPMTSTQWLVPSLVSLHINGDTGVELEDIREVIRARDGTRDGIGPVDSLRHAILNGRPIR